MRETVIANLSRSADYPVESADRKVPPPRFAPLRTTPMESKRSDLPCPAIIGQRSSLRTDLRDAGAASIRAGVPFTTKKPIKLPKTSIVGDPREGIGSGRVIPGGVKVR